MRQIAAAVQEGAKAYLNRQVITISVIAVIIFVLLFFFKDHATAVGFRRRRGLLACRWFYRNAHRRAGECAHDAGGDAITHESLAHRLQWRRGHRVARRRPGASVRRNFLHHRRII